MKKKHETCGTWKILTRRKKSEKRSKMGEEYRKAYASNGIMKFRLYQFDWIENQREAKANMERKQNEQ